MVRWSQQAKKHLRHIFEFIADDSKHYASIVTQEIIQKSASLNELPHIGKMVPEVGNDKIREFSLYSYRILYEIVDSDIYVLAIIHKRRDFKAEDISK